jgi:hypothetical protein
VKSTAVGGEERGYDGGKKVKGRKRHILVDTEGLVLKAHLHSAKVMDYEGIKTLLGRANERFPRLRHLWLDGGYRGEDKGADWVRKALGWTVDLLERPKKPAPEEVLTLDGPGNGPKRAWPWIGANCCPPKASQGVAQEVGGGADAFVDRPAKEDEQRLREVVCERGSVGVRCHDSPHDEANRPCLRTFHTASPRRWVNTPAHTR